MSKNTNELKTRAAGRFGLKEAKVLKVAARVQLPQTPQLIGLPTAGAIPPFGVWSFPEVGDLLSRACPRPLPFSILRIRN